MQYKESRFAVTANHCLGDFDLAQVRIFSGDNPTNNMPLNSYFYVKDQPDEEIDDIAVFRIDGPPLSNSGVNFFNLTSNSSVSFERLTSVIVGFPRREGDMDYDNPHIKANCLISPCKVDPKGVSGVKHYKRACFTPHLKSHPDGISGGAVFSIVGGIGNFDVVFEGIILRANEKYVHFVDREFILIILENMLEK